ncbi:hypothetical protein [Anabaena sp. UHCC 0399]|uniref:hypothetical protein n=1 Tax=Anabaena sp. UHCC 0399 TaxID=3110238 RepID=UPI0016851509|nr:hypothetical protein [Anabaena sp. UHCC 0399]MBD2363764.1 hypothetical protein [Anabaena minutissima FACHB-250]MEA5566023.1 hypothetical protein [Anabaena sp. UHCC 0399]
MNQNHEIVPQNMNEIESLNEIVDLDLESIEAITGGLCGTKIGRCPNLICGINGKLTYATSESLNVS